MSTGPDGALYLPHAPLRRAFSLALGLTTEPLVGGVSKWSATRHDLLARDSACAAADRAANAVAHGADCPESAIADLTQLDALRSQMLDAAERAVAAGELPAGDGRRVRHLAAKVRRLPVRQRATTTVRYHARRHTPWAAPAVCSRPPAADLIPLAEAPPFPCSDVPLVRHPRETKGEDYTVTRAGSACASGNGKSSCC